MITMEIVQNHMRKTAWIQILEIIQTYVIMIWRIHQPQAVLKKALIYLQGMMMAILIVTA